MRCSGGADRREDGHVIARHGILRRAAEGANDLVALRRDGRKEFRLVERRPVLRAPMLEEQLLQLGDRRPVDLEVRVAPKFGRLAFDRAGFRITADRISGAQIDAADDGGGAVDDQNLAVVAIVGRRDIIEIYDVDPTGLEPIEERGGRGARAKAVVNDVDLHAPGALGQEELAEVLAVALDVLEGVVFEIDAIARAADRREHRPESRHAVAQDARAVADHERALGDRFLDREMALQYVAVRRLGAQLVENCLALFRAERTAGAGQLRLGIGGGGLFDDRLHVRHGRATAERAEPDAPDAEEEHRDNPSARPSMRRRIVAGGQGAGCRSIGFSVHGVTNERLGLRFGGGI